MSKIMTSFGLDWNDLPSALLANKMVFWRPNPQLSGVEKTASFFYANPQIDFYTRVSCGCKH